MKDHNEANEVIERYVLRRLTDEERRAFEEHFLNCDVCFEKIQEMERFVAGVRWSSETAPHLATNPSRRWLAPAFALVSLALVFAGALIGIMWQSINALSRERRSLHTQLDRARSEIAQRPVESQAGNLPLAILDATRATNSAAEVTVPPSAREVALWIQLNPQSKDGSLAVRTSDREGHAIATVTGLEKNRYGALALALPAAKVPPGEYIVLVFREDSHATLGQYRVRVSSK